MADIFTTAGEVLVTDYFDGTAAAPANWFIGWGTGAGTAAKGDTTLFAESAETRIAATKSQPTASTNRLVATITSIGTQTITNVGVFTLVTAGSMAMKSDFAGVALVANDQIQFTFDLVHS